MIGERRAIQQLGCKARIRNTSPRPGVSGNSAEGVGLLGRFAADTDCWRIDHTKTDSPVEGHGDPLGALKTALDGLKATAPHAGAIGYVSYEWGARSLGLPVRVPATLDSAIPEMQFLIFEKLTHPSAQTQEAISNSQHSYTRSALDSLLEREAVTPCVSKLRYLADVASIKDHIAAGDIYQANYTQKLELTTAMCPEENYERLHAALPSPYGAFLKFDTCSLATPGGERQLFPELAVISMSPERFWRKRGLDLDSRPIKGTIGRAGNPADDKALRRQLLESRKDRAELLMITDLVRNDLGQVADIGSVRTDSLLRIRSTPSVWHLESTVCARLAPALSWVQVMQALAPAGSISGTPKRRAVEILASLEPVRRGPYCGAIGWIDASGDADFAVGIRTLVQSGGRICLHGGGGIVADSDPESEYYESLVKIAPLIDLLSNKSYTDAESRMEQHA
jgi:anthranilate/para-aminobenzoate synthase component I